MVGFPKLGYIQWLGIIGSLWHHRDGDDDDDDDDDDDQNEGFLKNRGTPSHHPFQ